MSIFAVVGKPIIHSKSPLMQNRAFKTLDMASVYLRLLSGNAHEAMKTCLELGIKGLNITAPFKEEFLSLVDKPDRDSKNIGAVNTMIFTGGMVAGFNTDPYGVTEALSSRGIELKGKKTVVLGAGGAARAAIYGLATRGARVTVANRTESKARELAGIFHCDYTPLDYLEEVMSEASILVSCISGKNNIIPPGFLKKDMVILDACYSLETPLIRDAKEKGCNVIDGREWLLFQGAKSFELFTEVKAPIEEMRKALYTGSVIKRNIALTGFMGCGKSVVAGKIAKLTGMKIIDTDANIEGKAGTSISNIFTLQGEQKFRELEALEIEKIEHVSNSIIDCGGGAVSNPKNAKILKENCLVVWLWASANSILKRLENNITRPLLNVENRNDFINKTLLNRMSSYANTCDILVDTENKKSDEIARIIIDESKTLFN